MKRLHLVLLFILWPHESDAYSAESWTIEFLSVFIRKKNSIQIVLFDCNFINFHHNKQGLPFQHSLHFYPFTITNLQDKKFKYIIFHLKKKQQKVIIIV